MGGVEGESVSGGGDEVGFGVDFTAGGEEGEGVRCRWVRWVGCGKDVGVDFFSELEGEEGE